MKKIKKNVKGFSLIELLLVMAIIGITSTIILTDWTGGRTTQQLGIAAREVEAVIREAQNYALTGTQSVANTEPCQFQISWSGSVYTITYRSKDGSGVCDVTTDTVIRTHTLRDGVIFSNSGSFYFSLPHAAVGGGNQTIGLTKVSVHQVVCVYEAGLINNSAGSSCP